MWGERVFAPLVFGTEPEFGIHADFDLVELSRETSAWLEQFALELVEIGYSIVGCSTSCGGLVPAVAILNAVKKIDPSIVTVLGGPACDGDMALGVRSLNTGIDVVFSGEGEITFPGVAESAMSGNGTWEPLVWGVEVKDLNALPLPDFSDYLEQKECLYPPDTGGKETGMLPYETSRGCWYGNCSFCGLNGGTNHYRAKSPDTVLDQLRAIDRKYDVSYVVMSDTIMPPTFFNSLLPKLADVPLSYEIFYEINANLSLSELVALKKAGITHLQPGIESLSSSLLKRMEKPVSVQGNIALMRYARMLGVNLRWMLMYGLPGDTVEEYEEQMEVIRLIPHLQPPTAVVPMKLCRNSKYQRMPERYGIENLRAADYYRDVLPPEADIHNTAYYLNGDFASGALRDEGLVDRLTRSVEEWRDVWSSYNRLPLDFLLPSLHVSPGKNGGYVLNDSRRGADASQRMELDEETAELLLVARPLAQVVGPERFLKAGLAIVSDSVFIPLATAEPELLLQFEGRET
jgi:ribosomal peptide maturation radical SAM protein 1